MQELNVVLQTELNAVVDLINKNYLILNLSKTHCIVFGSNHTINLNPSLKIKVQENQIEQVYETKLLGIIDDSRLSWSKHIDSMCAKMGRAVTIIKRYAKFLTSKTIKVISQALILSNLDYCSTVWSNATAEKIRKLQIIQNRAARMVLGCDYYTSLKFMHEKLNWLSVYDRLLYY